MLRCVTNLYVFVSALNIHTMSSVCFVLFISTVPSSCTAGTITLMDGRSRMEGRVEMCRGGVWGALYDYGGWDFSDAKITCKQLGYPSNCKLASSAHCHVISTQYTYSVSRVRYILHRAD